MLTYNAMKEVGKIDYALERGRQGRVAGANLRVVVEGTTALRTTSEVRSLQAWHCLNESSNHSTGEWPSSGSEALEGLADAGRGPGVGTLCYSTDGRVCSGRGGNLAKVNVLELDAGSPVVLTVVEGVLGALMLPSEAMLVKEAEYVAVAVSDTAAAAEDPATEGAAAEADRAATFAEGPTAEDPTAEDPTTEGATAEADGAAIFAEEPAAEEPATERAVAEADGAATFAEEPAAEEPAAEDPTAEDPIAEDPTAEDPTAEDPIAEDPTAEDPAAKTAAAEVERLAAAPTELESSPAATDAGDEVDGAAADAEPLATGFASPCWRKETNTTAAFAVRCMLKDRYKRRCNAVDTDSVYKDLRVNFYTH